MLTVSNGYKMSVLSVPPTSTLAVCSVFASYPAPNIKKTAQQDKSPEPDVADAQASTTDHRGTRSLAVSVRKVCGFKPRAQRCHIENCQSCWNCALPNHSRSTEHRVIHRYRAREVVSSRRAEDGKCLETRMTVYS